MHDVKWIKDNVDLFDKAMERLGLDSISMEVTSLYQEYVILLLKLQTLQNERNNISKTIGMKKSNGEDALIIIDIETNQKTRYTFSDHGIKAIFQPSWNPVSDNLIAFIGCNDNQSDIYVYDLQKKTLENLTNDAFTDKEVIWSNDGKHLLFSSSRYSGRNIQYDLYSLSLESRELDRLSNTEFNEYYPIPMYSDSLMTYISDANGIQNIYLIITYGSLAHRKLLKITQILLPSG